MIVSSVARIGSVGTDESKILTLHQGDSPSYKSFIDSCGSLRELGKQFGLDSKVSSMDPKGPKLNLLARVAEGMWQGESKATWPATLLQRTAGELRK